MEYKELALALAKQAGAIIKKNFMTSMEKEWKTDLSPVTATDLEINKIVIEKVRNSFPGHNVQGEEESHLDNNSEFLWVCDPVDGTIPFSHGVPTCTFSLALVKNGESILGVIYDPLMDRMYYAEKDKGSFLNGKRIQASEASNLRQKLIDVVVFNTARYPMWELSKVLIENGAVVSKIGSITYTGALVASGDYLGSIFPHYTAHDIAAVKIIVEEAGGKVTDIFGNEQRYDQNIKGAIISNGKVHDLLRKMVKESLRKDGRS